MAAVLSLVACNKQNISGMTPEISGEGELIVNLGEFVSTKVAGDQTSADKTIQNAQVFIFNTRTKQIDNVAYKEFSATTGECQMDPLKCTFGEKKIWAIVNAPKNYTTDASIKTVEDLEKITVSLGDNAANKLIMTGTATKTFAAATETVTVNVERLVAAVVLKSVRNEMAVPAYRNAVKITGAYLMNVPSVQRLDGAILASSADSPTSKWSAFYGKATAAPVNALLTEAISETSIAYEAAHTALHTFYTFSSDYEKVEGKDDKTSKSSVYLVVECKVDGVACVYPVLLPKLVRNNKYEVSLTINHVGGDPAKPWPKVKFASFTPTIKVVGWNNGGAAVDVPETI